MKTYKKKETNKRLSVLPARWEDIILHFKHTLNVVLWQIIEGETAFMLPLVLVIFTHLKTFRIFHSFKVDWAINFSNICGSLDKCYRNSLQLCLIALVARNSRRASWGSQFFLNSFIFKKFSFFDQMLAFNLYSLVLLLISTAHRMA